MKSYLCDDWSHIAGVEVEIRRRGEQVRTGVVDAVMPDSSILWLAAEGNENRTLFEQAEGYEAWADPFDLSGEFRQLIPLHGP
jgi:hypothetical protein